jgi:hypothetical protein
MSPEWQGLVSPFPRTINTSQEQPLVRQPFILHGLPVIVKSICKILGFEYFAIVYV